jgi:hypothetical protein
MLVDQDLMHNGRVDIALFTAAVRDGRPVGTCACAGSLWGSVDRGRGLVWLTIRCGSCSAERTSPDGRLARPVKEPGTARPVRSPRRQRQTGWLDAEAAELEARRFPGSGAV